SYYSTVIIAKMPVKQISTGSLQSELNSAGDKVVLVDFFAEWCGPCKTIAPHIDHLSSTHPNAVFLKIDVEKCQTEAEQYNITAMPTFLFFKYAKEVDRIKGANKELLESTLKKYYNDVPSKVVGHIDLKELIKVAESEALNEASPLQWQDAIIHHKGVLKSDVDEELILHIAFNQIIRLHSIIIEAPEDAGPKTVKLFINQTKTLDFTDAKRTDPVQTLE
ncbi:unnamed protein product, partial [Didymodactylos carnosus]